MNVMLAQEPPNALILWIGASAAVLYGGVKWAVLPFVVVHGARLRTAFRWIASVAIALAIVSGSIFAWNKRHPATVRATAVPPPVNMTNTFMPKFPLVGGCITDGTNVWLKIYLSSTNVITNQIAIVK